MGREIKRVALDFDWPLDKVWTGYVDGRSFPECRDCDGRGENADARLALDGIGAIVAASWRRPRLAALLAAFTGLSTGPFGLQAHDVLGEIIKRTGTDRDAFYHCPTCTGTGLKDPADQAKIDAWRATEPPAGDGWQLWETVSEGSPITPVFPTAEALVEHLVARGSTWDQRRGTRPTRAQAEALVRTGWAPSALATETSGVVGTYRAAEILDGFKRGQDAEA